MKSSIYILSFLTVALTSCNDIDFRPLTSKGYMRSYESFLSKIEKNHLNYSYQEWQSVDQEYKLYSDTWYEHFRTDLTSTQRERVTELGFYYHGFKITAAGNNVGDKLKEWLLEAENALIK